jgi:hypothetical protein
VSYRDDLHAAHARIAALEAQLATRDDATEAARDEREAKWRAEREALHADREVLHDKLSELRKEHNLALSSVKQLQSERDRLLERVRVLQTARAASPPAQSEQPQKIVPQPQAGRWPSVWDHNRRFRAFEAGTPANVACPQCRLAGTEVQMVRGIAHEVKTIGDPAFEHANVTCPRCLFAAFLRTS